MYAAKSLQSCPTLCDPRDGSPPGAPVPGILQARTLEWLAISFSDAWKWKVKVKSLRLSTWKLYSRVQLLKTPWTAVYQAPPSMGFSRQEYWSGVPLPSPGWMYTYTLYSSIKSMIWRYPKELCFSPNFFEIYVNILKHILLSSVQLFRCVRLFATPWITARKASLSITNSRSSPKLMCIESVMPSRHLILCHPLHSPPAPNPSQHQSLFQWVHSSHEVAKILEFQLQHQSFQWTPRTGLL